MTSICSGLVVQVVSALLGIRPVKNTASEMTYTVSGGALNSTQTKPNL